MECSLELTQVRQQRCDLGGVVLVKAMKPDQRVENEQPWLVRLDGVGKPLPVLRCVQAQRRGRDDLDWQRLETDSGCRADPFQTPAHHSQGVLSRKQEHRSGVAYRKLA